jgi:hypothetical protein
MIPQPCCQNDILWPHQTTINHVRKERMIQNKTTLMLNYPMATSCHDDPTNSNNIGVGWIIMVERRHVLILLLCLDPTLKIGVLILLSYPLYPLYFYRNTGLDRFWRPNKQQPLTLCISRRFNRSTNNKPLFLRLFIAVTCKYRTDKSAHFPANATVYDIISEPYLHKKRKQVHPLVPDESDRFFRRLKRSSFVNSVNHNNILPLSVQTPHSSSTTS